MTEDRLRELIEAARHDRDLLATLLKAPSVDEAVSAARQAGFQIENQDLEAFLAHPESQLSEAELEVLAGGMPNVEEGFQGRIPTFIACYTHQWMAGCGHTHNNKKGCK
jgi:predicted ribosomally synthesized peptide with nif11-like leader